MGRVLLNGTQRRADSQRDADSLPGAGGMSVWEREVAEMGVALMSVTPGGRGAGQVIKSNSDEAQRPGSHLKPNRQEGTNDV